MRVAIIMGSDSDLPVVRKAAETLDKLGIAWEMRVMSAHRTPKAVREFAAGARENGFGVVIAAAGKAAHLAGVLASHTTLPVIGIPIKASALGGLDALLSTVQMPPGVPVATVAIDSAENAALLAAQILAVTNAGLAEKLDAEKRSRQVNTHQSCFSRRRRGKHGIAPHPGHKRPPTTVVGNGLARSPQAKPFPTINRASNLKEQYVPYHP